MSSKQLWLRALGADELPERIVVRGREYRLARPFKHDFFAATGLYERAPDANEPPGSAPCPLRVVLKVGRTARLFGLPMRWIGRWLTGREARNYVALQGTPGVPRFLGLWKDVGLVHEFVEGHALQRYEHVDDEFFPRLTELIRTLHRRDMAYVDLEKRDNILVGDDGRPYLIDFQISYALSSTPSHRHVVARFLLDRLREGDVYHLLKHYRRHRPDQLAREQIAASYQRPIWVDLHRICFRPWTLLRRRALTYLHDGQWKPREGLAPHKAGNSPVSGSVVVERSNADAAD